MIKISNWVCVLTAKLTSCFVFSWAVYKRTTRNRCWWRLTLWQSMPRTCWTSSTNHDSKWSTRSAHISPGSYPDEGFSCWTGLNHLKGGQIRAWTLSCVSVTDRWKGGADRNDQLCGNRSQLLFFLETLMFGSMLYFLLYWHVSRGKTFL